MHDKAKSTLLHSFLHKDPLQQQDKTGLIEKKSGRLNGGWRAYSFTIDRIKGIFQYKRTGVSEFTISIFMQQYYSCLQKFSRSPKIELNTIKRIEELDSDGTRFPFEVHFAGKGSPWELNVYSEVKLLILLSQQFHCMQ